MFEAISLIASAIEISTLVYSGGRWVQKKLQNWKVPSSLSVADRQFRFPVEYFSLTTDRGVWREFKLGRESLREEKRLLHDRDGLLGIYPGLTGRLLVDGRIRQMPYEVLTFRPQDVHLSVQDQRFQIRPALRQVYDATYTSLVEHFRRIGIQYEPTYLPRVSDWTGERLILERAEYTDAAATNMIADLDLESVFNKTPLLENGTGTCNTLREYDRSLAEQPGCLPPFRVSSLANPVGVAGIALTADHKLILTHRPRGVSTYASRLGPSSSGYLTWHDLQTRREDKLHSVLASGLKREIAEELHLDLSQDVSEMYPLGFFREFYRAGMPQGFYAFRINLTAEKLVSRLRDTQDFRECIGILSIPVNRQVISRILATLVQTQRVGSMDLGLEAQGLLTALALHGEEFLF
jgi:hypothetical protein